MIAILACFWATMPARASGLTKHEETNWVLGQKGLFSNTYLACSDAIKRQFEFPDHVYTNSAGLLPYKESIHPFDSPDSIAPHYYKFDTEGEAKLANGRTIEFFVKCRIQFSVDGTSIFNVLDRKAIELFWGKGHQYRKPSSRQECGNKNKNRLAIGKVSFTGEC